MKRIFKYQLMLAKIQTIKLPTGSVILCIKSQNSIPTIWAIVTDGEEGTTEYTVRLYGTGHEIPNGDLQGMQYLGTVLTNQDQLVWHVFIEVGAKFIQGCNCY